MVRILRNVSFLVLVVACLLASQEVVSADDCGWGDENFYDGYNSTQGGSHSECLEYCSSWPNPGGGICLPNQGNSGSGMNPQCFYCQCYDCLPY